MPWQRPTYLTRDEIFLQLARRGVATASAEFSGGNDEGYVEDYGLYDGDGAEVGSIAEHSYRGHQEPEDEMLAGSMSEVLTEAIGGFNGDFSVNGTVTWDVQARTVRVDKNETVWQHFVEEI